MPTITFVTATGSDLAKHISRIAELRISVFREYPYLYEGTSAYEQEYLQTYLDSDKAIAVLAKADNQIVGVSTGLPMAHETDTFKKPFIENGFNPIQVFYCGESVLLPAYRGLGIYKHFFQAREQHARQLGGFAYTSFCGVIRPDNHPAKPADYQPLDNIWQHYGYQKQPNLTCLYSWQEIGQNEESQHSMQFWLKYL